MKTLFIVGNGFDIKHKLPTKYIDFKNYLIAKKYCVDNDEDVNVDTYQNKEGDVDVSEDTSGNLLIKCINDLAYSKSTDKERIDCLEWKDFENYLGMLSFDNQEPFREWYVDENDDDSEFKYMHVIEDKKADVFTAASKWKELFAEWVHSIPYTKEYIKLKKKRRISRILRKDDCKVLSFNYTLTIEEKYLFKKVCHIHGDIGQDIFIFGHEKKDCDHDNDDYISFSEINSNISRYYEKPVEEQYKKYLSFFNEVGSDTNHIYSFGFSFSDVDLFYIKKIIDKLSDNCTWHINKYKKTEVDAKKTLMSLGFKGKVKFY